MSKLVTKKYILPFALITSLFFMWGFARAILDVLNKHFQESLSISITQSTLIQATTYLGYFLMAIPAGIIITRLGYRRGVVIGLLLFAAGSLLFIPGSSAMSFTIFLIALFVIGCGLVILETAANPYASVLGSPDTIKRLLSDHVFRFGLIALFCYEISEISINSLFINYTTAEGWMDKTVASAVLSFGALGLFMFARVGGSWIMSRIKAEKVLAFCGFMTVVSALLVAMDLGTISKIGLFSCYAFEAIMFPTIFAITIARVDNNSVKIASSLLMMTPIGGAVGTLLMGLLADATSMSTSFIIPAAGYIFVFLYSLSRLSATRKTA